MMMTKMLRSSNDSRNRRHGKIDIHYAGVSKKRESATQINAREWKEMEIKSCNAQMKCKILSGVSM